MQRLSLLSVKVKICGITNLDDALAAVDVGADVLGFNFYPKSPRYIEPDQAVAIIRKLPTFVDTAGIFVNAAVEEIAAIAERGILNWIQLHGDESPDMCNDLNWLHARTIKAIRVRNRQDIARTDAYHTDAILLDAFSPAAYGGTGRRFDWNAMETLYRRVFLAGGITPENAAEAVETGVYGIDVCSGIEAEPGRKDHEKMQRLFANIRHLLH